MRVTTFGAVAIGDFFKETPGGAWHLKISRTKGEYYSDGVNATPAFGDTDTVYIDPK